MAKILVLVGSKQKGRNDRAVFRALKDLLYADSMSDLINKRMARKINPELARGDPSVKGYIGTLGCKCEGFEILETIEGLRLL